MQKILFKALKYFRVDYCVPKFSSILSFLYRLPVADKCLELYAVLCSRTRHSHPGCYYKDFLFKLLFNFMKSPLCIFNVTVKLVDKQILTLFTFREEVFVCSRILSMSGKIILTMIFPFMKTNIIVSSN